MFINMSDFSILKNIVDFCKISFIKNTTIEVQHQDKDYISNLVYADSSFFINILFATSISPCET